MTTHEVVSPLSRTGAATSIELALTLDGPTQRIAVHSPGLRPGRADALFGGQTWAAKHHWTETRGDDAITTYEFDEPLPAGQVVLRIPV